MSEAADAALIGAVQAGDAAGVARALADGADPDVAVARFRMSVLIEAVRAGRLDIVTLLVDAGAGVGPFGRHKVSPLRVAVLGAHTEVVRYLIAHGALAAATGTGTSALTEAVRYTWHSPRPAALATLRALLDAGATTHPGEEAPLITAVMQPAPPAALRLLLANGADPDQARSDGTPAIVIAARRGDHAAVDVLLEAGADVDARDRHGRTALMHAVERNERQVVAALLTAGATPDLISDDGMTALRLAQGWHHQNVQFMLGEMHVGLDDVPITRTSVRTVPTGVQLRGDPRMLTLIANVIDTVLADLGDDEWHTRSGRSAETARNVAGRLRDQLVPATRASWHRLDVTADEFAAIRSALVELAHGTTRTLPHGTTHLEMTDLLAELDR